MTTLKSKMKTGGNSLEIVVQKYKQATLMHIKR